MNFCVKVKISQNKKEKVPLFHNNQLILDVVLNLLRTKNYRDSLSYNDYIGLKLPSFQTENYYSNFLASLITHV